jgi:hypothetical protein
MAGFPFQHFAPNIKCVVASIAVAAFYWQVGGTGRIPPQSMAMVAFLLWFTYIALAWYDYLYDVPPERRMKPTLFPLGRLVFMPFKDPAYQEAYAKMSAIDKAAMDTFDKFVVYGAGALAFIVYFAQR